MRLRGVMVVVGAALMIAAAGCSGNGTAPSTRVTGIQIVPDVSILKVGTVTPFSYLETKTNTGVPPTGPPPVWSTTNTSVASVDGAGRVSAAAPGATTLRISFLGQTNSKALQIIP